MKTNGMNLSNTAIKKAVKEIRDVLHTITVIGTKHSEIQERIDAGGGEKKLTTQMLKLAKQKIEELENNL